MLRQTHHLIINEAIDHCGPWPRAHRREILRGNDDEDVHVVPILHWRLRAAGLTHTHVPEGRFGELWFPSAKQQCLKFVRKAQSEKNDARAAWWLGRACHLLGDVAVPARARRIWHFKGDPLEAWIEQHLDQFRGIELVDMDGATPDELIELLALVAWTFPADTTRTPWGHAKYRWIGLGRMLGERQLQEQARDLIPRAVTATKRLLDWVDRR
ncbi:MAG TPA: hypothetical protein PKA58_30510 [Polyangium sp.]|jgi:hypothetical protein|nr:hypothetical protein [Polyangium sp.]